MSEEGLVFETREFCLHDGPGIRTTVFFKGCPLRCAWCHNPEGLSPVPQLLVSRADCSRCGACERACPHPPACLACGACTAVCPQGARRLCGRRVAAEALAEELKARAAFFEAHGGGLTFSGGEPLAQPEFLVALARRLRPVHLTLETCGYAPPDVYREAVGAVDLVLQDLKHPDPDEHRRYTGVDPRPIFENLAWLKASGRPFVARIPLIPGVNDAPEVLARFADLLAGESGLLRVELLPYHLTAGAKHALLGLRYEPPFDAGRPLNADCSAFAARSLPCRVL